MTSYFACNSARAVSLKIRSSVRGSGALIASGRSAFVMGVSSVAGGLHRLGLGIDSPCLRQFPVRERGMQSGDPQNRCGRCGEKPWKAAFAYRISN
ncbi:hypothetical protein RHECNPAF_930040 [Rhizobium etli CNPAF512]|nr:hypothetical protein RHECNPAF_930040 [Rhizobium etli CNPAF512]